MKILPARLRALATGTVPAKATPAPEPAAPPFFVVLPKKSPGGADSIVGEAS
jgi:hypothetical protein